MESARRSPPSPSDALFTEKPAPPSTRSTADRTSGSSSINRIADAWVSESLIVGKHDPVCSARQRAEVVEDVEVIEEGQRRSLDHVDTLDPLDDLRFSYVMHF